MDDQVGAGGFLAGGQYPVRIAIDIADGRVDLRQRDGQSVGHLLLILGALVIQISADYPNRDRKIKYRTSGQAGAYVYDRRKK